MADELIAKAQAGDMQAFSQLVLRHQSSIRGYLARKIFDPDDVFDVAQEVFLAAYRSLGQFDASRDFGLWLRGIARHRAIDHLRKTLRRRTHETGEVEAGILERLAAATEAEAGGEDSTDDQLARLRVCVDKLQKSAMGVISMRYFQHMSALSIGAAIGKKENAVRILLMRVRQTLRKCLESEAKAGGLAHV